MSKPLNVALALDLALQHVSQLIEFCDVNGYGQKSAALRDAREFEEELTKFVRYRKCCHNCAHCRPDAGGLHVGKTEDPLACFGDGITAVYIDNDPGIEGFACPRFFCKYEGGNK